jgi:oligopeptide transport system substrate-binding protein
MRFVVALIAALVAFGTPARAEQVLHRPEAGEPESIDPQQTVSAGPRGIARDMFVGLVALSAEGRPVPGAATHWEVSADQKVWTFHLRADATWSNGDPVTAEDFVYAFRRLVDPQTGASDTSSVAQIVGALDLANGRSKDPMGLGVEAVDPLTLRLTLKEPRAALPLLLTDPTTFPLHRPTIERWGNLWTQPDHVVSNGPYTLTDWVPQAEIVLTRNPRFFDAGRVKIDTVHWIVAEDQEAALRRYRAGELDWVPLSRNTLSWAEHAVPGQIHAVPVNTTMVMAVDMTHGPLAKDVRLREALSLAIDRETLVTKIDPLGEPPAYAVVPDLVPDYTPQAYAWRTDPREVRLARARKLMAQAGYGPDHPLALSVIYSTRESIRQILLAIRAMCQEIGVDLTPENREWQAFVGQLTSRNFDLAVLGVSNPYDDYEVRLGDFVSDPGPRNFTGYANPAFDDLFHRGATAPDGETRRSLMQQAEKLLLSDYPVIPLEQRVLKRLINPKLQGGADRIETPQTRYLYFQD